MAGETEVETPAQPEVTEEKKEIAEAENKTEEKKGGDSTAWKSLRYLGNFLGNLYRLGKTVEEVYKGILFNLTHWAKYG